ncbi:hypothetical protein HMI55_001765 [Coelomomyces lativittatus]|nr:hypothetical protein HMI55_001765 [Coelomomyces lativittatus]
MAELKKLVIQAKETHTHRFLHSLFQQRKLLRCYTQNIDGLEFPDTSSSHPFVQLHGTLSEVVCSVCHSHHPFLKTYIELYQHGDPPLCPKCLHQDQDRQLKKQRLRPLGVLKPAVILYNETHPQGDWIAECLEKDLRKKPDVLVVMGTSLKVHGVKKMVRALAHAVHQRKNGLVILVNRTPLPKKEWENVFDMVFTEDVDSMVKRWSAWMHFYQQRSTHFSNLRLRRLRRHQNPLAYPPHLPHPSPPHAFRMSMDLFQCPADSLPSPLHLKNEVTNTSHEMENQLSSKNTPTHEKYKASSFLPQEIYSSPPLSIDVPCITLSLSKKKSRASSIKEFGFPNLLL